MIYILLFSISLQNATMHLPFLRKIQHRFMPPLSLVFARSYVFIILCMLFCLFLPSSQDFLEKHRKKPPLPG